MKRLVQILRWSATQTEPSAVGQLRPALARWFATQAAREDQQHVAEAAGASHAAAAAAHASTSGATPSHEGASPHQDAAPGPGPSSKPEYYSATPHIMDARSIAPLKSSEYASSHDDKFGIQKIWFTSLYKQLNYFAKTGTVPELKGRQKEVFEGVERAFEGLYDRHIHASGLSGMEHRAMLMVCLSVATYRILSNEIPDPKIVRDVIRTNQGSMMMGLLMPLHRFRIWILRYLLAEEPYKQAVQFLPALQADMGGLCTAELRFGPEPDPLAGSGPEGEQRSGAASSSSGMASTSTSAGSSSSSSSSNHQQPGRMRGPLPDEASLVVKRCRYHEVLSKEDAPFLLSDFCCNHGLLWLQEFGKHGVDVSLDKCMAWEDECCSIRLARRKAAA